MPPEKPKHDTPRPLDILSTDLLRCLSRVLTASSMVMSRVSGSSITPTHSTFVSCLVASSMEPGGSCLGSSPTDLSIFVLEAIPVRYSDSP